MNTPMQLLKSRIGTRMRNSTDSDVITELGRIIFDIEDIFLEREKKVIMDTYDIGWSDAKQGKDLNDEYYYETFNIEEQ